MPGQPLEIRSESLQSYEVDPNISKTGFLDRATILNDHQNEVQIVEDQEENNLSRSLGQRHIQMIALAGAIVRNLSRARDHG
jgi:amino acid permease